MEKQIVKVVAGTPFATVEKNDECVIIIGNHYASQKKFKTRDEAIEYINKKPYELIGTMIYFMFNELTKKEDK